MNLPSEDTDKLHTEPETHLEHYWYDLGFKKAVEMLREVNNNWAEKYLREKMGKEK
jgi:hypothetical protein